GKEALCIIPVKNIRAVEKLAESAFNRKNMFQVLHSEKPLYVQAGNCVEASEWVEVLSQVSRCNPDRLGTFHPSAYGPVREQDDYSLFTIQDSKETFHT
ncbi:unnamed protein product, partial [Coregonus sp. 'balchen']